MVEDCIIVEEIAKLKNDKPASNLADACTMTVSSPNKENQDTETNTAKKIEPYLNLLIHASNCVDSKCTMEKCAKFKGVFQHYKQCKKPSSNPCNCCRQLLALVIFHAKKCEDSCCSVLECLFVKTRLNSNRETKKLKDFITENYKYFKVYSKFSDNNSTHTDPGFNRKRKRGQSNIGLNEICLNASDEDDLNSNLDVFYDKLNKIIEKQKHDSTNRNKKFTNMILCDQRNELVNYIFKQTVNSLCGKKEIYKDKNFLNFALFLIRQEIEINNSLNSQEDYFYLLADLAFRSKLQIEKYAEKKETRETATQTLNETESDLNSAELEPNENEQIKKMKLEE